MSTWPEPISNVGQPYGGIPNDEILFKLEETDPSYLTSSAQARAGTGFTGSEYKDHMISEMLDRTPDPGFLESDRTRRNPQMSREMLNLRFNGTRGTHSEMPRHPDLFLGFTGNDPRGVTNDPRFDEMRKQMEHRVHQLSPQLTDSVGHGGGEGWSDFQVAERPWTGPSLQKARVDMHEAARKRMKIFTTSKDGRSTSSNVATYSAAQRAAALIREELGNSGTEQWTEWDGKSRSDARPATWEGFANNQVGRNPQRALALKNQSQNTSVLPTAHYGRAASGRSLPSGKEARVSLQDGERQQQVFETQREARHNAGGKALAKAMSAGARAGRTAESRDTANADGVYGAPMDGAKGEEGRTHGKTAGESDVIRMLHEAKNAQVKGQHYDSRAAVGSAAMRHKARVDGSGAAVLVAWSSIPNHGRAALATNMSMGARKAGQHALDSSDNVRMIYESLVVGARPDPFGRITTGQAMAHAKGRGVKPGDNTAAGGGFDTLKQQASAAVQSAAAARNLELANYSGQKPVENGNMWVTTLAAQAGAAGGQQTLSAAAAKHLMGTTIRAKAPEHRGFTQAAGAIVNDDQELERGGDEVVRTAGHRLGLKSARYDRVAAANGDRMSDELIGDLDGGEF